MAATIDEHGYSTYGGNSHLFADPQEGWVFIEFAGGEGLWAAKRLGPDEVRVSCPGCIGEMPADCATGHEEAMRSENLVAFAEDQGWFDPEGKATINLHDVFGAQSAPMRNGAITHMEEELRSRQSPCVRSSAGRAIPPSSTPPPATARPRSSGRAWKGGLYT